MRSFWIPPVALLAVVFGTVGCGGNPTALDLGSDRVGSDARPDQGDDLRTRDRVDASRPDLGDDADQGGTDAGEDTGPGPDVMADPAEDLSTDVTGDVAADAPADGGDAAPGDTGGTDTTPADLLGDVTPDGPTLSCPGNLQRFTRQGSPLCCNGTATGDTCSGTVCALDGASTGGNPLCTELSSARCIASGSLNLYGGWAGGFCCSGDLTADRTGCTASICALDYLRSQGQPFCSVIRAGLCVPGSTVYGDSSGGFCCGTGGTVTNNDTCTGGTICALNPASTAGQPICYQDSSPLCIGDGFQSFYGGEVGGFCCNGALGTNHDTCTGTANCALDPLRSQGVPYCPSLRASICVPGSTFYGESAGGFCCGAGGTVNGGSCTGGSICALDPARTQGFPVCYQNSNPVCVADGFQNLYGGEVGGFCCNGALGANHDTCNGTANCALDPLRSQGVPFCPSLRASICVPGSTFYGESAGGFCCGPGGTVNGGSCSGGSICAIDPARAQGFPVCYQNNNPVCVADGYQNLYGGEVGGFCCGGPLSSDHGGCTSGGNCALDYLRSQGAPFCPSIQAGLCPAGSTLYGDFAGGFCCGPGGTVTNNDSCSGAAICALNPNLAQGLPVCPN